MTDGLLRRVRPRIAIAPLHRRELAEAYAVVGQNPVAYVMLAQHIEGAMQSGRLRAGGLWAVHERSGRDKALIGVVWTGANLIPAIPGASLETLREVGDALARRIPRPSALVGEADVIHPLWERTQPGWGPARSVRDPQLLMALSAAPAPQSAPDAVGLHLEPVRRATLADFDYLLPAAVDMFRAEVGYDPLLHGRAAYEERLRWLIRTGRSYVQYGVLGGERGILFKAEVGVLSTGLGGRSGELESAGVAELQGVWVHKELRRRGIARAGLAAVVEQVQQQLAPTVSLYVNDFNAPAVRAYEALGFARVGTFVTVML